MPRCDITGAFAKRMGSLAHGVLATCIPICPTGTAGNGSIFSIPGFHFLSLAPFYLYFSASVLPTFCLSHMTLMKAERTGGVA